MQFAMPLSHDRTFVCIKLQYILEKCDLQTKHQCSLSSLLWKFTHSLSHYQAQLGKEALHPPFSGLLADWYDMKTLQDVEAAMANLEK